MTYLVDVNVLSEPTRPAPEAKAVNWLNLREADLVVDPIILGELQVGVLSLPPGRKRSQLARWFAEISETVECLPWDAAVSRCWAELIVESRRKGRVLPLLDSMIAATALTHDLTVATRNTEHFRQAGTKVCNPFA